MSDNPLSRGFARRHPEVAARVLEGLPADMAGEFLAQLEPRHAMPLLSTMVIPAAAECLASLSSETAASLVAPLPADEAGALLRAMPTARAQACLAQLSAAPPRRLARLMRYPEGSVGSRIQGRLLVVPMTLTVGQTLKRVKGASQHAFHHIYVVDEQDRLVGVVSAEGLLRAGEQQPLTAVIQRGLPTLPVTAALDEVAEMPVWRHHQRLPVVDNRNRLVGEIDFADLSHQAPERVLMQTQGQITALEWIWRTLARLLESCIALIFSYPRVSRKTGHDQE